MQGIFLIAKRARSTKAPRPILNSYLSVIFSGISIIFVFFVMKSVAKKPIVVLLGGINGHPAAVLKIGIEDKLCVTAKAVKRVYLGVTDEDLEYTLDNGVLKFTLPKLQCHESIVIDY